MCIRDRAYIFHNSGSGTFSSPARTLTGSFESDQLGWDVAGVGDVDNDGYDHVLVGGVGSGYGTHARGAPLFFGRGG